MAKANSNPKDVMDHLNRLQADIPVENKPIRIMCLVEQAKVAIQLEKVDQAIEFANEAVSLGNKQARLFECFSKTKNPSKLPDLHRKSCTEKPNKRSFKRIFRHKVVINKMSFDE